MSGPELSPGRRLVSRNQPHTRLLIRTSNLDDLSNNRDGNFFDADGAEIQSDGGMDQIEFLLRQSLAKAGRLPQRERSATKKGKP